ncbi:hypothetical protein BU17DRAFT_83519 [Hysterangium stoloniferum]|nr:hypothetical protein BU17DRAFT_83519 [Hysterangium stoloniferum]
MPYLLNLFAARSHQPQSSSATSVNQYDRIASTSSASEHGATTQRREEVALQPPSQRRSSIQGVSSFIVEPPSEFSSSESTGVLHLPARSSTPLPHNTYGGLSSSPYASDDDSEPTSPLLSTNARRISLSDSWWSQGRRSGNPRWRRRSSRDTGFSLRTVKRRLRRLVRHPCFPRQPISIILSILIFTIIAIIITFLLIHILNPDKAALPWRTYCSLPQASTYPPSLTLSPTDETFTVQLPIGVDPMSPEGSLMTGAFPPNNLDEIPPMGVFLAVFSVDSAIERRMLIRSTWASHERSRSGAGTGDGGNGTSRTIVRFVLGKPRSDWERRIQLESDVYNDMVHLPISENMNSGKTHAFFTWAAENAWVPPPSQLHSHTLSYSNHSTPLHPALHLMIPCLA